MLQLDNFYKARFVLSKVIRKTELVHKIGRASCRERV